jgi:hypothetical protein
VFKLHRHDDKIAEGSYTFQAMIKSQLTIQWAPPILYAIALDSISTSN